MRNEESARGTTSTVLEPSHLVLESLVYESQPTVGEQQVKMALAALTPRIERVERYALVRPWVVASAELAEVAAEIADTAPEAPADRLEWALRCPYCRSMTYEVRVTPQARGLLAVGLCSLCGTRGESFRPHPPC